MKERPIIFNAGMVRAILDGRKTQTRREIKPQPTEYGLKWRTACGGDFSAWEDNGLTLEEGSQRTCLYGQPGDRLWVRETWRKPELHEYDEKVTYDYKATCEDPQHLKWKSPLFMPRSASRILLDIKNIRVERLNDISEEDAKAEGCRINHILVKNKTFPGLKLDSVKTAKEEFIYLWESIKGTGSWNKNPWVWVIEFERLER